MSFLSDIHNGLARTIQKPLQDLGLGDFSPIGTVDGSGIPTFLKGDKWIEDEQAASRVAVGAPPPAARKPDPALPVVVANPGVGGAQPGTGGSVLPPDFYSPTPAPVTPSPPPEPEHHAISPVGRNANEPPRMSNDPAVLDPTGRRHGNVAAGTSAFARVALPTGVHQG